MASLPKERTSGRTLATARISASGRKRMKKSDVKVRDRVRVRERVEGYYSNYGGRPAIFLEPGMVGIVGAIDVPSVCREGVSFVCVDFFCIATSKTERAAVYYPNLRRGSMENYTHHVKATAPPLEIFETEQHKIDANGTSEL